MKKFSFVLVAVVALIVSSIGAYAEDCSCSGESSAPPSWVDPATPSNDLPCFSGAPTPEGFAGAVPYYDYSGELKWVSNSGDILCLTGGPLAVAVCDSSALRQRAGWDDYRLASKVILLQNSVRAKGRALSVVEVFN